MKKNICIYIREDLIERSKNVVAQMPSLTLSGIFELATEAAIAHLEEENGGAFPQRVGALKRGKRINS